MEIIKMHDLTFTYPDEASPVIENISKTVYRGEFVVICGASGSGKTTLLRLLKKQIEPHGKKVGQVYYRHKKIDEWDDRILAAEIGFVFQNPDNQIVMDDVFQEIIFGMEQIEIPPLEMRKRLAELVHFFGLEDLLDKKTSTLSGGQKQLVNLLSVLLLRPKVLLLDEPTSQLDPVAAKELVQMLKRLNEEMGITIIMIEHRLEDLFSIADQVWMLENGKIKYTGKSKEVMKEVYEAGDAHFLSYIPSVAKLFLEKDANKQVNDIPLNVKEARQWMQGQLAPVEGQVELVEEIPESRQPLLTVDKVYFQYERKSPFVLKNCCLQVQEGEFFALVGGNGAGKSTLLRLCMGMLQAQRGKVSFQNKALKKMSLDQISEHYAYLPQEPLAFYMEETIREEMIRIVEKSDIEDGEARIMELSDRLQITPILDRHPNDISGGELQRATIACLLLKTPTILCMDEPTKGLDVISKKRLAAMLLELQREGLTIFMVTHDIEFAVQYADRCAILFDGDITATGTPAQLFKNNYFYTTAMNRATMDSPLGEVLTLEEALQKWP